MSKTDKEIITAACDDVLLIDSTNMPHEINLIISKLLLLHQIQKPTELQMNEIVLWIKENYRAFTPEEMILAFKLNLKGEYGEVISHFQSLNVEFISKIMNAYQESKRKAWAEFNKYKPNEPKQIEAPINRLESLIKIVKETKDLPQTWDWSGTFKQMWDEGKCEDSETMKKWMAETTQKIKSEISLKIAKALTTLEKMGLEKMREEGAIKQELRRRYVRKRITELELK